MSIAVTGLPCARDASTKPSSDAKLMLNAPRIFEYLCIPIPLASPVGVRLSRARPVRQAGLQSSSRRLRMTRRISSSNGGSTNTYQLSLRIEYVKGPAFLLPHRIPSGSNLTFESWLGFPMRARRASLRDARRKIPLRFVRRYSPAQSCGAGPQRAAEARLAG